MKAIGFLGGRYGDAVMCTVAARQFKAQFPHAHLTFAVSPPFGNIFDLVRGLPYVDDFHVWEGGDNWPTPLDTAFIKSGGYNVVFNALAPHTTHDWYNHLHYVDETCLMLGLRKPASIQCELGYRPRRIEGYDDVITTSLFASGAQLYKTFSTDKMRELFAGLTRMGYRVIQIGATDQVIDGAENRREDLCTTVDILHSSRLHLSIDTALSWIASAYSEPLVGFYGVNYADMSLDRVVSHNPVNPNATYLNRPKVDDISVDEILEAVRIKLTESPKPPRI